MNKKQFQSFVEANLGYLVYSQLALFVIFSIAGSNNIRSVNLFWVFWTISQFFLLSSYATLGLGLFGGSKK